MELFVQGPQTTKEMGSSPAVWLQAPLLTHWRPCSPLLISRETLPWGVFSLPLAVQRSLQLCHLQHAYSLFLHWLIRTGSLPHFQQQKDENGRSRTVFKSV